MPLQPTSAAESWHPVTAPVSAWLGAWRRGELAARSIQTLTLSAFPSLCSDDALELSIMPKDEDVLQLVSLLLLNSPWVQAGDEQGVPCLALLCHALRRALPLYCCVGADPEPLAQQ